MPNEKGMGLPVGEKFSDFHHQRFILPVLICVTLVSNVIACKVLYKSFLTSFLTELRVVSETSLRTSTI